MSTPSNPSSPLGQFIRQRYNLLLYGQMDETTLSSGDKLRKIGCRLQLAAWVYAILTVLTWAVQLVNQFFMDNAYPIGTSIVSITLLFLPRLVYVLVIVFFAEALKHGCYALADARTPSSPEKIDEGNME